MNSGVADDATSTVRSLSRGHSKENRPVWQGVKEDPFQFGGEEVSKKDREKEAVWNRALAWSRKGVCERGKCRCRTGWTGSDCACRDTNETCLAPNGKICTGHGECVCGVCKCRNSEEGTYSGVFCERSSTYPLNCDEFRECVECQIFPYDNDVPAENCNSCIFISIGVDKVEIQKDTEKLCTFYDDKDCRFTFKYELDDEDLPIVRARRRKDCPVPRGILATVLGIPTIF
ncbi:integrin beta-PS [Caerostris extrusa]|uniref:Integrin beta-PS n=1 Tax=Caerostris extrusa TaxID=172846 RepID=A0AAV4R5G9_CAEEX|nr:integrin beta-PS [Caerostris extrusa]